MAAFNPYSKLGATWFPGGLDDIIAGSHSSLDEINATICTHVRTELGISSSNLSDEELQSIVPHAVNAYINGDIGNFDPQQQELFSVLISGIKNSSYTSISDFIEEFEERITEELPMEEQIPLLFATTIAKNCFTYWNYQIDHYADAEPPSWHDHLNSDEYKNRSNVSKWVTASVQATMFAYGKGFSEYGITNSPQVAGPSMVTVLAATLGVTAGLLLFNWQPKLKLYELYKNQDNTDNPKNTKIKHWQCWGLCSACVCSPEVKFSNHRNNGYWMRYNARMHAERPGAVDISPTQI